MVRFKEIVLFCLLNHFLKSDHVYIFRRNGTTLEIHLEAI